MPTLLRKLAVVLCALLLPGLFCPASGLAEISPALQRVLDHSPPETELSVILSLEPSREVQLLNRNTGRDHRSRRLRTLQQATRDRRSSLSGFLSAQGVNGVRELWLIQSLAITARAGVIARLAEHPEVAAVHLNRTYAVTEVQPLAYPTPGWNLEPIGARDLWDLGFRGQGAVVAVLDSGVELSHPDLQERWRGSPDNPESGWFDPFALSELPTDLPSLDQNFGHGTAVTGVILAGDQSGRDLGVAPGAKWIAARIFDANGQTTDAIIVDTLQWVMDPDGDGNGNDAADIVNTSWGLDATGQCLPIFRSAVQQLKDSGIAMVAAAGNSGPASNTSESPANYPEVLAVGATDQTDLITDFSSRGPSPCDDALYPDLVAPGVGLTTTNAFSSEYATVAGTSFSAPQVSGILALLMEAFPDAGIATLETALRNAAVDLGTPGADDTYGYGRLDALAAYDYLTGEASLEILDSVPPGNDRLIDFASIPPGQSAEQDVVLRNAGGGQLEISAQVFSGQTDPFTLNGLCAPTSLFSGESCTLEIRFAPEMLADYSAALQIVSNDPDTPEQVISIVGTGNTPPPPPQLDTPADGARVNGPEVTVSWFQSADADGDTIGHEINWAPVDSALAAQSRAAGPAGAALLLYAGAGGLLLLALPAARCRRPLTRALLIALLLALALLLPACGGGGGGGGDIPDTGTPGSFTLSGLAAGVTYEWWVVAEDSRGGRTSSAIRTFQVE